MPFVYLDVSAGALHALRYVDHGEGKRCSTSTSARESEKGERDVELMEEVLSRGYILRLARKNVPPSL